MKIIGAILIAVGVSAMMLLKRITRWELRWHRETSEAAPLLYRFFPTRLALSERFLRNGVIAVAVTAIAMGAILVLGWVHGI